MKPDRIRFSLVLLLMLFPILLSAQLSVSGTTVDGVTKQPISFVNIQLKGTMVGAISDLQGKFTITVTDESQILSFSCVGYHSVDVIASQLLVSSKVSLMPQQFKLAEVTVVPGMNPATEVMRRVVEHADEFNPNLNHNYSAIVYHKLVFSLDEPILSKKGTLLSDMLLIEGVSEKMNKAPDKHAERMISGRVRGFKDPALAFLAAQLQPFTFYEKEILLLGENYLNPVSQAGLRNYNFILEDTLWDSCSDTLLYISFFPKKGSITKTMRGTFHIRLPQYVVTTVTASSAQENANITLDIRQNYRQHDEGFWFPDQLESTLHMNGVSASSGAVTASGKSYVATVNFNPQFGPHTFSGPDFTDEGISADDQLVDRYRQVPFTASDSAAIFLMDSLSRVVSLDRILQIQKSAILGSIPIGKIDLEYHRLLGYNAFEGWKTGLGLSTNEKLWPKFRLGGYAVFGFRDENWKYGAQMRRNFKNGGHLMLKGRNDVAETGSFLFLDGFSLESPEIFHGFLPETMDREKTALLEIKTPIVRNLDGQMEYRISQVEPLIPYRFRVVDAAAVADPFRLNEVAMKIKWMPGQKVMKNTFGITRQSSAWPTLWLNATYGAGNEAVDFKYLKFEARIHQIVKLQSWSATDLRIESGIIRGKHPDALLYSAFGIRKNIGIELPFSLATMQANEFAVSQFNHLFFRHTIYPFAGSHHRFKPEIALSANGGWSNASTLYKTYEKGYYETGVVVDNLLNVLIFKYGVGFHYRLGHYRLEDERQNWAINWSLKLMF